MLNQQQFHFKSINIMSSAMTNAIKEHVLISTAPSAYCVLSLFHAHPENARILNFYKRHTLKTSMQLTSILCLCTAQCISRITTTSSYFPSMRTAHHCTSLYLCPPSTSLGDLFYLSVMLLCLDPFALVVIISVIVIIIFITHCVKSGIITIIVFPSNDSCTKIKYCCC